MNKLKVPFNIVDCLLKGPDMPRLKLGMSEKRGNFFSKYADHVITKYAAKICGNRPRLHAQSLFSKFTAYLSLESTCICLLYTSDAADE